MKPFDYYSNVGPYPLKKDSTNFHVYFKGKKVGTWHATGISKRELVKSYPSAVIEEDFDAEAFSYALNKYNVKAGQLREEFIQDLFKEFDVSDNPKARKCYDIAYGRGHSYGYSEVYNEFADLVELIR